MSTAASFYWFDYETFGTHPAWDRPCQFAGVRTDMDLNEISEPLVTYCRQAMDYLPNPVACKVTGLTPQHVNEHGVSEREFIQQIVEQIGRPGTCSLGYNSIRFDDEFTRYTLFRNFFDPYEHEYKDGSNRWDMLDIVRLTRALRPEGINWPVNDDGSASNRLEHLSVANGIEHGQAHDALSDVRATIGIAKLIRQVQPRLFEFAFTNKSKQAVMQQLNVSRPEVCLLVSGTIASARSHIAAILPLFIHPDNRNSLIVIDLDHDPSALLDMNADDMAQLLFTKHSDTESNQANTRPGLRTVQINKCPVVVPLKTMRPDDALRLGVDLERIKVHADIARKLLEPDRQQTVISAMTRSWPEAGMDVDGSLYTGSFLSPADKQLAAKIRQTDPQFITDLGAHFEDRRLVELAWRYQARNHPDTLDAVGLSDWQNHCYTKLTDDTSPWLTFQGFDEQLANASWSDEEASLKNLLLEYRNLVHENAEQGTATD